MIRFTTSRPSDENRHIGVCHSRRKLVRCSDHIGIQAPVRIFGSAQTHSAGSDLQLFIQARNHHGTSPRGEGKCGTNMPWYRRVATCITVVDEYPPSPFVTSHSRDSRRLISPLRVHDMVISGLDNERSSLMVLLMSRGDIALRPEHRGRFGRDVPSLVCERIDDPGSSVLRMIARP